MDALGLLRLLDKNSVSIISLLETEISGLVSKQNVCDNELETLAFLLKAHVESAQNQEGGNESNAIYIKVIDFATRLSREHRDQASPKSHLLQLFQMAYSKSGPVCQRTLQDLCLQSFKSFIAEDGRHAVTLSESNIDPQLALAICYIMFTTESPIESTWLNQMVECVEQMIMSEDEEIVGKVLGIVLPGLLKRTAVDEVDRLLLRLWEAVEKIFDSYGQKTYEAVAYSRLSGRPLMVLCSLGDRLFPVDGNTPLIPLVQNNGKFWSILQAGLFNSNPLTRKRGCYILKRILDTVEKSGGDVDCCLQENSSSLVPILWWSKEFCKHFDVLWQDYILLLETLEEKQVHVIKPILPRIGNLITAAHNAEVSDRDTGGSARPLLHTSWICVLLQRMACHESSFIRRAGITELLRIDMTAFPLLQQNGQEFMTDAFIAMLAESVVYYKPPEVPLGDCAPAGHLVGSFLKSCMASLKEPALQGEFLQQFIASLSGLKGRQWSGVALVFVSRGLSQLPTMCVCGPQVVQDIRSLLLAVLTNLEIHLRGAIQCFLTTAVTKILDTMSTEPSSLTPLLSIVRSDECLCRGTSSWSELVSWLREVSKTSASWSGGRMTSFISEQINQYINPKPCSMENTVEVVALVRLLLLATDAQLLPSDSHGAHPLVVIMKPVIGVLLTVNSHAYMSPTKADHAIHLLATLIQELECGIKEHDELYTAVHGLAAVCKDEVLLFIIRRISSEIKVLDDVETVSSYRDALLAFDAARMDLLSSSHLVHGIKILSTNLQQQTPAANQPPLAVQLCRFASATILGTLASIVRSASPSLQKDQVVKVFSDLFGKLAPEHTFSRPVGEETKESLGGLGSTSWGRISASFIRGQWECVQLLLESQSITGDKLSELTASCCDALDVTTGPTFIPVFQCLKVFIAKLHTCEIVSLVELMWQKVIDESRNTLHFWACLDAFCETVITAELLLAENELLSNTLTKIMNDFLAMGEEKRGLVNVLFLQLSKLFKNPKHQVALLNKYCEIFAAALMFGPIHDKNQRYSQEVLAFLIGLGNKLSINQLRDGNIRNDSIVRVLAFTELSRLSTEEPAHVAFAHRLSRILFARHRELIQNKRYRGFNNSLPHRQKQRLMVAILILHPFILKDGMLEETMPHMLQVLAQENQPSVRFMVEWLLVRLTLIQGDLNGLEQIVSKIEKDSERQMAYLCSLFNIATHICKNMDSRKQEECILRVMPAILPWCTMHHFNCRTFAQACLLVLWRTAKERGLQQVLTAHSIVEGIVTFQMNNINQSRGTQKLLDNFFFHFNPLEDFSLETLLWTLPWLSNVTEEEWVQPEDVARCVPSWKSDPQAQSIPLFNPRHHLNHCTPGTLKIKITETEDFAATEGNVQKKLIPWTAMLPEEDLELELREELPRRRPGELIIVTSLIDKVPNLGGLCRTSEIFGAAEFVIGNLKYVKLHEFETLSVTAHKWVPIKEVRPWQLKEYLLEMKDKGYTLVGAEQTADSVSLRDYSFQTKTVLLLGNEKEGIPVELIQLLDVCVEIPQQGVVRSLNVHVSGALLVWEYTRQHLAKPSVS